ncbi:Uncharacterised protein [Mycobacteroides abscessus subsp. abscessus]|nr:Uncharacterised protein [Mycobacteroides abscessus subsp. abscessus]
MGHGQPHDVLIGLNQKRDGGHCGIGAAGRIRPGGHQLARWIAFHHGADHVGDARTIYPLMLPARTLLPVRDIRMSPVLAAELGVGDGLPHPFGRAVDVRGVDECWLRHVRLLRSLLDGAQRPQPRAFELVDPPFLNFVQRNRIEIVQLLAAMSHGADQVGGFEYAQMLGRGLTRHGDALA